VRSEVDDYSARAYKAAKASKDDSVALRLKEVLEDFREVGRASAACFLLLVIR
jgi:hypothetical protein